MKQLPKVSLCMIVKNEEKYLRECLESVKDIIDEIIIVDTGSVDSTIKIAKEFNAELFQVNWVDDFSAARNFALSKSTGNWILYLDADERLSEKSVGELKRIIDSNELKGFRCLVNSIDEINGRPNSMMYTRLFHNHPKIRFSGKVHEQIDDSLSENGYKILDSGVEIIHIGYNVPADELKKKAERNLNILQTEYEKNSSAYNAYQLANTYFILEDHEKAYHFYETAVIEKNLRKEYKGFAYLNLAGYEYKNHNIEKAVGYLKEGLNNDSYNPLLNLLASEIYFRINNYEACFKYCKDALNENKNSKGEKKQSALSIGLRNETILSKGIYYGVLSGNKIELNFFLGELKKKNPVLFGITEKLINNEKLPKEEKVKISGIITKDNLDLILVLLENYSDKKEALEIILDINNTFRDNSKYLKTLGLLYFENNRLNEAAGKLEESLRLKEKDPASLFYLVSVYLQDNRIEKIPALLLMAEKEFGRIPEFKTRFEILKQKLSTIIKN